VSEVKIGDDVRSRRRHWPALLRRFESGSVAAARIQAAYEIGDQTPELPLLIKEVIDG